MWLKWAYRRPRVTPMAGLICSRGGRYFHCSGYLSLQWLYSSFYALHKRLVSYCCHGEFANASRRCTVMNRMYVFGTSDSKHYTTVAVGWHRVSHCSTSWWAFLLNNNEWKFMPRHFIWVLLNRAILVLARTVHSFNSVFELVLELQPMACDRFSQRNR